MKITCLLENTAHNPELIPRHGLSLFIDTPDTCLLFDTGPDTSFSDNASHLGLDLSRVDTTVLSHGHYDHGGGLARFQQLNGAAPIYMSQKALGHFFAVTPGSDPRYIGIDQAAVDKKRCRLITSDTRISEHMTLFTDFISDGFIPPGNQVLFKQTENQQLVRDDFAHELALLIREGGTTVLVTGCSHSGIGNMLATVLDRTGLDHIDHVIGGFHLNNQLAGQAESIAMLEQLASELSAHPSTRFYTGHCTGQTALDWLTGRFSERVSPLFTGWQLEV